MPLTPRWYQKEAIDETINFLFEETGHGVIESPTASGKSLMIAEIAKRVYNIAPSHQIICLTDITALIGQNRDELTGQWPEAHTTVYSASYGEKKHAGEVVFAGIQSIYKKAHLFTDVSVILIDEIHRASLSEGSMYYQFYQGIKANNPHVRIIGLSGTPWKINGPIVGTWICDKIIYSIKMSTLFKEKFLCPLITPKTKIQADLSGVKIMSSGEYNEAEMQSVMDDDDLVEKAVKEAVERSLGRKSILVFASGVNHAEHIRSELAKHGEFAEIVVGETDTAERRRIVKEFDEFRLRWLISVGTLTTGFNSKVADCGVIFRATQSSALWLQIVGRLLRTHECKSDALVLDFGGNIERFGRIDQIKAPPSKKDKAQAKRTPFKKCFNCGENVRYLATECPFCFQEFGSETTPNHGTEVSTNDIMSVDSYIKDVPIDRISFCKHHSRRTGSKSLRVSYHNGLEVIHEYFFPEGKPFQRSAFCEWWSIHSGEDVANVCPKFLDTALEELKRFGIKKPDFITVDYSGVTTTSAGNTYGHKVMGSQFN